jgi:hypothetical protein
MYDDECEKILERYSRKEDIIDCDGKRVPFGIYAMEYGDEAAESMLNWQRKNQKKAPQTKNTSKDFNNFEPKENKHKQKPINGQFLALPDEKFFNNEEVMKKIANKTGLLLYLLRNIVDWNKNERLNLYQEYFIERKLLVASISRHRLAEIFGKDVRRITAWVKALEKDGILKIERIPCIDEDDHRKKYNVYILGEVNDDKTYTYYYEK